MGTSCNGYVRRVTHEEIAERIGENLRNVLGTPADLAPKGKGKSSMPRKRANGQSVVASGELRSASHGEGETARTSITDDASTHPLVERLRTGSFRARDKVAVPSHLHGKSGEQ